MKLKEVFYMLGLKPKPKRYGSEVIDLELPEEGKIQYAVWQHPRCVESKIDQGMIDELRKYLSPGDTAIDIGAHVGDTTVPMAFAAGRTGTVFGLEPNEYIFPVLEANSRLNTDRTHLVPLPFAATPEDGTYVFEYSDAGFCNGGQHNDISRWKHGHQFRLTVQGRNLPRYLAEHHAEALEKLRFLKVDAEGADATILESLADMIAKYRPFIRAEVYRHLSDKQREQLYEAVAGHDYTVHRFNSLYDYRGDVLTRKGMGADETFDIFGVPN